MGKIMNENDVEAIFTQYGTQIDNQRYPQPENQEVYIMKILNNKNEIIEVEVLLESFNFSAYYGITVNEKEVEGIMQHSSHFHTRENAIEVLKMLNVY